MSPSRLPPLARPRRGRGLLFALGVLLALPPLRCPAASASADRQPETPAELRYERIDLPNEDNAVIDWTKSVAAHVPITEPAKARIRDVWSASTKPIPAEEWAPIASWVEANAELLRFGEESLRKPKAQWPLGSGQARQPALPVLTDMVKARLAQADALVRQGRYAAAVDSLLGTLRLGQLVAESDGSLIHYLMSVPLRSLAGQAMQRLAANPSVPVAELRRLLDALPPLEKEPDHYVHALRVEFDQTVTRFAPLVFAETWTESYRTRPETVGLLVPDPRFQRVLVVFLTPTLVAHHPQPLDRAARSARVARDFMREMRNARAAWKDQEVDREEQLRARYGLGADVEFRAATAEVMDAVENESLPLSREAAERARPAYNRFTDPVGRLIAAMPDNVIDSSAKRIFCAQTEREATRAILALEIYRREHGGLPLSLEGLLEEKVLPALPKDAFSGLPLRYDRRRERLWSVGEDGRDDGGEGDPGLRWQGEDAVWKLVTPSAG